MTSARAEVPWRWALAALVAAMLVHAPSLAVPFFWDDGPLVRDNAALMANPARAVTAPIFDSPAGTPNYYRPAVMSLYAAVGRTFGTEDPRPFQAVKLLFIGAAAAALVLFFAAHVPPAIAFLLALLVIVYPPNLEAWAWISGLADVLAFVFGLVFILTLRGDLKGGRLRWRTAAAFAAALLAKEGAVALAPLALLLDAPALRRNPRRLWLHARLWGILGVYAAGRASLLPAPPMTPLSQLAVVPQAFAAYLVKLVTVVPLGMSLGERSATAGLPAVAGAAALAAVTAYAWFGRRELLRQACALFVAGFLPYSHLFVILGENYLIAERYMLWLSTAAALALGGAAVRLPRPYATAALAALCALYAAVTGPQYLVWQDGLAHWRQIVTVEPAKIAPRIQYAADLDAAGLTAEAREQLRSAARTLRERSLAGHRYETGLVKNLFFGLADLELRTGNPDLALPYAREAFRIAPSPAIAALGVRIHAGRGDMAEAARSAARAAAMFPADAELASLAVRYAGAVTAAGAPRTR